MNQAFVYDALRTPRGRGKKDGSLHEVKPIRLLSGVLRELQSRNQFDTAAVDDVVMGVVSPIGEQGSVLPKVAALVAGWDWRCSGVQLNRFCASGLEAVNMAAMKVRSGWEDLVVAGGIESMSRVPIGSDGGAWAQDPETNSATLFVPQGIGADLIATIARPAAASSTPITATLTTSGAGEFAFPAVVALAAGQLKTNLVITTSRRTYLLELSSTEKTWMASVSWEYPRDRMLALQRQAQAASAACARVSCIRWERSWRDFASARVRARRRGPAF